MTTSDLHTSEPEGSPLFGPMFEGHVAQTDGKEPLACAIGKIAREMEASSFLDLGAGDGALTGLLSPRFAGHRHEALARLLAQAPIR